MMSTQITAPTARSSATATCAASSSPANAEEKSKPAGETDDFASLLACSWFSLQQTAPANDSPHAPHDSADDAALMIAGGQSAADGVNFTNGTLQPKSAAVSVVTTMPLSPETLADDLQSAINLTQQMMPAQNAVATPTVINAAAQQTPPTMAQSFSSLDETKAKIGDAAMAADNNSLDILAEKSEGHRNQFELLKTLQSEALQRDSVSVASALAATRQTRAPLDAAALKTLFADDKTGDAKANAPDLTQISYAHNSLADATAQQLAAHKTTAAVNTESLAQTARQIAEQVAEPAVNLYEKMSDRESRTMHLRLRPDSLGQVDVQLTRGDGGRLSARLTADHDLAHRALSEGINHLREALEQAGLQVERLDVSVGVGQNSSGFSHNGSKETPFAPESSTPAQDSSHRSQTEQVAASAAATNDAADSLISLRA